MEVRLTWLDLRYHEGLGMTILLRKHDIAWLEQHPYQGKADKTEFGQVLEAIHLGSDKRVNKLEKEVQVFLRLIVCLCVLVVV